jgi:hypothetical protein
MLLVLSSNIRDAPAQTQLISAGISLFSNISGTLTGEAAADARELYNLVTNWKCLKSRFNFYMSFINNNNDCNFNIDRQKTQDQMNKLDIQMAQAGENAFSMIKSIVNTSAGNSLSSQGTGQQISAELKSVVTAINDIQQFVDLLCDEIRIANDKQIFVIVNSSYSGHEISQLSQSVL